VGEPLFLLIVQSFEQSNAKEICNFRIQPGRSNCMYWEMLCGKKQLWYWVAMQKEQNAGSLDGRKSGPDGSQLCRHH